MIGYHMITGILPMRVRGDAVPMSVSDFAAAARRFIQPITNDATDFVVVLLEQHVFVFH